MKYFDCENSGTALTAVTTSWPAGTMVDPTATIDLGSAAVATPLCLFAPTVGAALNQRVGRKVHVYKLKVRGTITVAQQAAQAAADPGTKLRMLLVQDIQTNAGQMTGAQLMNGSAVNGSTTINSYQNPNNFGRFRVLKDKILHIGNVAMTGSPTAADVIQSGIRMGFKFNVTFRTPVIVHFNATNGGTVLDIVDNSFHLVMGVDGTTFVPTVVYYSRVAYKDV